MTHKHLDIGGFGFPKKGFQILKCFGFPEWLPELEVVEASVQDGCDQGDGEDGVEQVDLLHNGQVRKSVLLQMAIQHDYCYLSKLRVTFRY